MIMFVFIKHDEFDFYSGSSLTQVHRWTHRFIQTHYADNKPNSLFSYSLKLHT
jgi:hypothetical protein